MKTTTGSNNKITNSEKRKVGSNPCTSGVMVCRQQLKMSRGILPVEYRYRMKGL